MKRAILLLPAIISLSHFLVQAQESNKMNILTIRSLNLQFGYGDAYVDDRIGGYPFVTSSAEFSVGGSMRLKIHLDFFQTNKSLPWRYFQYRNTVLIVQRPTVWTNWSLGAIILQPLSTISSVGLGIGAEYIEVRKISYREPVFWVDFFSDTPYIIPTPIIDVTESLLKPSIRAIGQVEWEWGEEFFLFGELHYKISFVGSKYGQTALNSQNSYGISLGLKYLLE